MRLNKAYADLKDNPESLLATEDLLQKIVSFSRSEGLNPQKLSTIIYPEFGNFSDNVGLLNQTDLKLDESIGAKFGHVLSFQEPGKVAELLEIYTMYKFPLMSSASKPKLSLFSLDPNLVRSYLDYLLEIKTYEGGRDYSKNEIRELQKSILSAEYDEHFMEKYKNANEALIEMFPVEMAALGVVGEDGSMENNLDSVSREMTLTLGVEEILKNQLLSENDFTYITKSGEVFSKNRVNSNVLRIAKLSDINQDNAIIIALFSGGSASGDQIIQFVNPEFENKRVAA